MPTKRLSSEELWKRGNAWYDNHIRSLVEIEDNIGKLITINVETGDYEITTWIDSAQGSKKLIAKHPDAQLIQKRIGYEAVDTFGGIRIRPKENAMPTATLEALEQRIFAMEQEIARLKQERTSEPAPKKGVRDRLLEYMAEGPHLSPETAEQLRKDIYEARGEHLG